MILQTSSSKNTITMKKRRLRVLRVFVVNFLRFLTESLFFDEHTLLPTFLRQRIQLFKQSIPEAMKFIQSRQRFRAAASMAKLT